MESIEERRNRLKAEYQAYRDVATKVFHQNKNIKIPEFANVFTVHDGAFVEAVIWVPSSEIKLSYRHDFAQGVCHKCGQEQSYAPTECERP